MLCRVVYETKSGLLAVYRLLFPQRSDFLMLSLLQNIQYVNNQDLYLRQDKLKLQFSHLNSSVKNIKNKSLLILQKVTSKKKIVYRVCALQFAMMTVLERLENEDAYASMTTTTTTRIQKFAYPAIKNNIKNGTAITCKTGIFCSTLLFARCTTNFSERPQ